MSTQTQIAGTIFIVLIMISIMFAVRALVRAKRSGAPWDYFLSICCVMLAVFYGWLLYGVIL